MGCYTLLPCAGAWDLLQSVYKPGTVAVFCIQAARTIIIITIAIAFCLPQPCQWSLWRGEEEEFRDSVTA